MTPIPLHHKHIALPIISVVAHVCLRRRLVIEAFPGKVVVLAEDTRQLPPVVPNGGEADTTAASVLSSAFYRDNVEIFHLSKTMRNKDDPGFSKMVDDIGDGISPTDEAGLTTITGVRTEQALDAAIDFVFPGDVLQDPSACAKRGVISTHNDSVARVNAAVLARVDGETYTLRGRTMLDHEHLDPDVDDFFRMSQFLNQVEHSGVPSHEISLKERVVVMLCRNLSIDDCLTNGTKVVVVAIQPYTLQVQTLDHGKRFWLPRIAFNFVTDQGVAVKRVQFPVRLCFCLTVHRAQGQTLDKTCFDLTRHPFAHGHLYVGLSRVRKSDDIIILTTSDRIDHDGFAKVHNVVFKSLLPGVEKE